MFIFEKVGHSKFIEMHGDTSDLFQSASKSDWYFLLNDEACFVLDQHAKLDIYSATSLKQQSANHYATNAVCILLEL
jgi:hypothetical protein